MHRRPTRALLAAAAILAATSTATCTTASTAAGSKGPVITSTATLPDIGLAAFQNAKLPGSITDDHGIHLGGIGSDLYRDDRDKPGDYWMVTDRGPNDKVDGNRTFPVPTFDPTIVHVHADGTKLTITDAIPLRTTAGAAVTGLPNVPGYDETGYDADGKHKLTDNPNGLDTEGLVRAPDGSFWLADEYAPSLVHVSATGTVLDRYVPAGWKGADTGYPLHKTLPAILLTRDSNHGFEALALDPDGHTLYAGVQAPLDNPDEDTGKDSRNARILRFDIGSATVTGEFLHRFAKVCDVDTACNKASKPKQKDLSDSAMAALGGGKLLVEQHTDDAVRLDIADLNGATNILGTKWDDPKTEPSLEQGDPPSGVTAVATTPAVALTPLGLPGKIEGIAVVSADTVAVANDNDFGIGDDPQPSRVWTVKLTAPLPGAGHRPRGQ